MHLEEDFPADPAGYSVAAYSEEEVETVVEAMVVVETEVVETVAEVVVMVVEILVDTVVEVAEDMEELFLHQVDTDLHQVLDIMSSLIFTMAISE